MKLQFEKYQGTGNDFIMVMDWDQTFPIQQHFIQDLCTRKFGIGADGLILVQPDPQADYRMVYFNSDGRESTMCGNGGRCIAHFAQQKGVAGKNQQFTARDGLHEAKVGDQTVALTMQSVDAVKKANETYILDTGSPHYVSFVEDTQKTDVKNNGHRIRNSEQFRKAGINVNFVSIEAADTIHVRTYERGVEAETLSCGTGVVASAIAYHKDQHKVLGHHAIQVHTFGGTLRVHFDAPQTDHYEQIWLEGPVANVFSGSINIEE